MDKNKTKKSTLEKENLNLVVFERLCYRAKEIVFNTFEKDATRHYLYVFGLDDDLVKLSPIEQIFYIAKDVFTFLDIKFRLSIASQEYVEVKGKKYRTDFYVDSFVINDEEFEFEHPILVELDGYNYHSTKEQRNRDCERENDLKLAGYNIIRFTGTQVFNEPFECVRKVYEYAAQLINKKEYK